MTAKQAWLIDVWETLFSIDFDALLGELAKVAGVAQGPFGSSAQRFIHPVTIGRMSGVDAFLQAALECGAADSSELRTEIAETGWSFVSRRTHVYQDTISFMKRRRREGDLVAFLSNCGEDTRPLLEAHGLLDAVDAAFLSCEVGVGKPDREIFDHAVTLLGVDPGQATLVDDQLLFCEGAVAAGVRAIHLVRASDPTTGPSAAIPRIRSFDEI